jgi:flagellar basal body-associated protein FliL
VAEPYQDELYEDELYEDEYYYEPEPRRRMSGWLIVLIVAVVLILACCACACAVVLLSGPAIGNTFSTIIETLTAVP